MTVDRAEQKRSATLHALPGGKGATLHLAAKLLDEAAALSSSEQDERIAAVVHLLGFTLRRMSSPEESKNVYRLAMRKAGWPVRKIATTEGITTEAVKQSLRRARRALEKR